MVFIGAAACRTFLVLNKADRQAFVRGVAKFASEGRVEYYKRPGA